MAARQIVLAAKNYDLSATLDSGQVFRWELREGTWTGIVSGRWARLQTVPEGIQAEVFRPVSEWNWLQDFLQTGVEVETIYRTFPNDEPMQQALEACWGLRLLRQDPWECLASFILSSTKQIVQIRQIVSQLCETLGEPIATPPGEKPAFAFPTPERIAGASETALRGCKMGFRAPYLLAAAEMVAGQHIKLESLRELPRAEARMKLMEVPGVGGKIADCVLLFAYGFDTAFPVDVWIARALQQLYFRGKSVPPKKLHAFAANHFGPHAGYAQQYLFHYIRTKLS